MDLALMFFWGIVGGITVLAIGKMTSYRPSTGRFFMTMLVGIILAVTVLVSVAVTILWRVPIEKPLILALGFLWIVWVIETFSPSPVVLFTRKKEKIVNLMGSEPE